MIRKSVLKEIAFSYYIEKKNWKDVCKEHEVSYNALWKIRYGDDQRWKEIMEEIQEYFEKTLMQKANKVIDNHLSENSLDAAKVIIGQKSKVDLEVTGKIETIMVPIYQDDEESSDY